jgi:two-component system, cell cycle sensor histidine kinase and response regulator CckA
MSERPLLDRLPSPVFIVQQGRFAYVNAAFADVMGLSVQDLLGHEAIERVHPDDRLFLTQAATGPADAGHAGAQVRVRRADGTERSLSVTTVPITHGGAPARLGTAADVTLQPDVLNISVWLAALGRLAGGIAHDFNNLLLVVGGQLDRLQAALPADGVLHDSVRTIGTAADRAAVLTDRLLSFGRRQVLEPEVLDPADAVTALEPELARRVGPAVRLTTARSPDVAPVRTDRPRLREALWHLVDNARDAMPAGGALTIAVDTLVVDETLKARWTFLAVGRVFVRVRVTDTGSGMDPDVVPHVFEPFFTTKGRGRGAGMGLASVYGFVKQTGGYVFVEHTGPQGTRVTILLPPAGSPNLPRRAAPAAAVERAPRQARVLLVEDDDAVRELLADVLTAAGFDVASAGSAEEARRIAADGPVDLLLSDLDLPGQSGAQLAASLQAAAPPLRVILMSGYPDDGAIAEAGLAQRPVLLRKPFATALLVERIREALSDRVVPHAPPRG